MHCKINNKSDFDITEIEDLIQDLFNFSRNRFGFKKPPVLNLMSDKNNKSPLGKTAHYDPNSMSITIYVDGRHPKDIMRSFSHELIHHRQNEKGMFDNISGESGDGYAQSNPHLRKMEKQAYLQGNMCFRDWEDGYKTSNPNILNERRIYKMSTKDWKNKELGSLLNERWGFSMDLSKLNESKKKEYDLEEGHERIFAPNHYCLHHVIYEGKQGKTVDHNWDERLQKVTKYDVKFEDGSVIRNIHESKLTVLEAFTESSHSGKKDDGHPAVKREEKMPMKDEPKGKDINKDGKKGHGKVPAFLEEEEVEEDLNKLKGGLKDYMKKKQKEGDLKKEDKEMGDNPEGVTELMDAINELSEKESEQLYNMLLKKHGDKDKKQEKNEK